MDFIKELQSFKTIVEEGTFTKAAAKLNYAQSTVTNHIKKLETELEVALFLEGKSNVLTLEGELLKQAGSPWTDRPMGAGKRTVAQRFKYDRLIYTDGDRSAL